MPAKSRRERLSSLERDLISGERWVSALLVVKSHTDEELFRVGGCWDRHHKCYVDREVEPHVIHLQESQLEAGIGFARWLKASLEGNPARRRLLIAGGNRGSGKTWLLAGVGLVAVALAYPGDWQFGINITAKQRRECLEDIRAVARPEWITADIGDFRDMRTEFLTGNTVQWLSSQNPRAIRQAGLPIRFVLINEGQDQPESVFINSIAAIRNTGGLVGIATNPPRVERGDWIAALWSAIDAGEINGEKFLLDNKLNRAIDQASVGDIASMIRVVSREAAEADADGIFHLSGPLAYPAFSPLAYQIGGHVGDPPDLGWVDVTRELTAEAVQSGEGFDYVCGVDFQRQPGIIGAIGKLYRDPKISRVYLWIVDTLGVRGVESDFSQGLISGGYSPAGFAPDGTRSPSILLVGDGTGARQNAEHKFSQPPSFTALRADGWKVVPPMYHWKRQTPWNPLVKDSRAQMHLLLDQRQVLFSRRCAEAPVGFPPLLECMRRAKVGPRGGLVEKGNFQHSADGVRYLAWRFLPRPKPAAAPPPDVETAESLRAIRVWNNG